MGAYWSSEDFDDLASSFAKSPPVPPPQPEMIRSDLARIEFVPTVIGYKTYIDALKGRKSITQGKWIIVKKKDEA